MRCSLTQEGLREQGARYARLAPATARVERQAEALVIEFADGFDRATLDEALAVERECCPFFRFGYDDAARRLRITVGAREHLPALDALAHAFCRDVAPPASIR